MRRSRKNGYFLITLHYRKASLYNKFEFFDYFLYKCFSVSKKCCLVTERLQRKAKMALLLNLRQEQRHFIQSTNRPKNNFMGIWQGAPSFVGLDFQIKFHFENNSAVIWTNLETSYFWLNMRHKFSIKTLKHWTISSILNVNVFYCCRLQELFKRNYREPNKNILCIL